MANSTKEEPLLTALKVIRTWAAYDMDNNQRTGSFCGIALVPEDVVNLIDKVLEEYGLDKR